MKQNIRNVVVTFALVALTTYTGTTFYKKQVAEEVLLTRKVEATQLKTEEQLRATLTKRKQKLAVEAFAAELAEAKRQAEAEVAVQAEKAAEELAIAVAKDEAARVAAAQTAAKAEAQRQADVVAAQKAAKELAIRIASQQAAEAEAARIAAQKAAELATADAASKKSSRQSRAS